MSDFTTKLYGNVKKIDGTPSVAVPVRLVISPSPQHSNNTLYERAQLTLLTDELGHFEQDLPGGIQITVVIPSTKFQATGVLPLTGEINVINLGRQY
jgi:hypothetical protein